MQITTMHTLAFTFRAANGRHALASDIINAATDTLNVEVVSTESLPLPNGEDAAMRNSKVQIRSTQLEILELYWNQLQQALALVGVEATSP